MQERRHRHHRHPKSRRRSYSGYINEDRNISKVRPVDHEHYHALFGNMLPSEMAKMLNDTWVSPDWYLVAIPRKKNYPKTRRHRRYCVVCSFEVLGHVPQIRGITQWDYDAAIASKK